MPSATGTHRKNIAASRGRATTIPQRSRAAFPGCLATPPLIFTSKLLGALTPVVRGARLLCSALLDLLAPGTCRHCGLPAGGSSPLCAACVENLPWITFSCRRCGSPVTATGSTGIIEKCGVCSRQRWAFSRVVAAAEYAGPLRSLVLSHKYHGDRAARCFLVFSLFSTCKREALLPPGGRSSSGSRESCVVTSVPQHRWKRLARGRDPARELAEDFASGVGVPYRVLIRKRRWTAAQVSLSRGERVKEPLGSFRSRECRGPRPARVLLVDDVFTTGTTVSECARVLRATGVEDVVVLVVGRSSAHVPARKFSRKISKNL